MDEPDVVDELYCTMLTNVVGIQYYQGMSLLDASALPYSESKAGLVGPGEEVTLVREPHNKYDRLVVCQASIQ